MSVLLSLCLLSELIIVRLYCQSYIEEEVHNNNKELRHNGNCGNTAVNRGISAALGTTYANLLR